MSNSQKRLRSFLNMCRDSCILCQEYFCIVWIDLMKTVNIKYQTLKGQTPCRCFKRRLEKHQHLLLNPNNEFLLCLFRHSISHNDNHYEVNIFFFVHPMSTCICFWLMEIIWQEYISVLCFIILCLTYM